MENGKIIGWMLVAGSLAGGGARAEEVESIDAGDEETFVRADADKDGELTFEEAVAAGLSDGSESDRAGWKRFADGNGRLKRHLFHEACRRHRQDRDGGCREGADRWKKAYGDPERNSERFERADADGSGDLTRAEAKAEATPLEERLFGGKRFDRADTDGDGSLTRREGRDQLDRERKFHKEHKDDRAGEKAREKIKQRKNK